MARRRSSRSPFPRRDRRCACGRRCTRSGCRDRLDRLGSRSSARAVSDRRPLAVQLFSFRDYIADDPVSVLRRIVEMGFVGVEVLSATGLPHEAHEALARWTVEARELKRMLDDLGLLVCGAHTALPEGPQAAALLDEQELLGNDVLIVSSLGALPGGLIDDLDRLDTLKRSHPHNMRSAPRHTSSYGRSCLPEFARINAEHPPGERISALNKNMAAVVSSTHLLSRRSASEGRACVNQPVSAGDAVVHTAYGACPVIGIGSLIAKRRDVVVLAGGADLVLDPVGMRRLCRHQAGDRPAGAPTWRSITAGASMRSRRPFAESRLPARLWLESSHRLIRLAWTSAPGSPEHSSARGFSRAAATRTAISHAGTSGTSL